MAPLTVFLAKLIGLYCVLFGLAMALQKQAMVGSYVGLSLCAARFGAIERFLGHSRGPR